MSAADLVTLPSYREGCPNVVIEALAAGRPVVATDVGGIPELMDSTCGRLVPPQDVPALADALDQTLSQTWSAAAISSRHSRSWANVAADLHEVLNDALTPTTFSS
jgi:glycosyltransferase involved in cell wall biosynthesis